MNEVAKVFLATNSDYKYTDVSIVCVQLKPHCLGEKHSLGHSGRAKKHERELALRSIS